MAQKIKGYPTPPSERDKANEMSFREFFESTVDVIYADGFEHTNEISLHEKIDIMIDAAEMYCNMKLINSPKPKKI